MKNQEFKMEDEFKYIIWFEDDGKGSIKNNYGVIMWYKSKKGALDGARFFAERDNKNVLIQRGLNVSRMRPNGDLELVQGDDNNWI